MRGRVRICLRSCDPKSSLQRFGWSHEARFPRLGFSMAMTAAVKTERSPWIILLVLCLGFFMILLDLTIVNVGIPSIIASLRAGLDEILWVLNAYILVYAVLLITAGRLGDMYGPKNLFLIGLVVFTGASIACSVAQNPGQLIAARAVQGAGGAILTPQTLTILTNIFAPNRRGAAFAVWGGRGRGCIGDRPNPGRCSGHQFQ